MPPTAVPATNASLRCGSASAAGRDRRENEDAVACGPVRFAVADGMGGHRAGTVARQLPVDEPAAAPAPTSADDGRSAIEQPNARIRAAAAEPSATGMGATLGTAARMGNGVGVASIGDARCHRLLDGTLTPASLDHRHVQEPVDLGRLSWHEAERHPLRHVVTRALGGDPVPEADLVVLRPPVGRLQLCSDGLPTAPALRSIGQLLAGLTGQRTAAERLVALAHDAGDDVTAVVVDVPDGPA